jgi:hypothetical protein
LRGAGLVACSAFQRDRCRARDAPDGRAQCRRREDSAPGSGIVNRMAPAQHDPASRRGHRGIPAWAERLVLFLDDGLVIPGTGFRIGFDAVLGLIPGVGDFVTTASGLSLVWLAYDRGAPAPLLARMLVNLGLDALIGAIPILGDLFDVVFKANRRNLTLLQELERHSPREAAVRSAGFFAMVAGAVILLLTVPVFLALALFHLIFD